MVNVTWVSMTDIFAEPLALTESQNYGNGTQFALQRQAGLLYYVSLRRALSSGGERHLDTVEVSGSNPLAPTM